MIRAVNGLMGLGMLLLAAPALANLSLVNYNGFEVRQSGNTWTFSHEPPSSTALRGGTVLPNAAVSSSQRALVVSKTLPVGKGLPVDVVAKIPAAKFAKAMIGLGKATTPIGAALTAVELIDYLKDIGIEDVKNTDNGLVAGSLSPNTGISDGYEFKTPYTEWLPDPFSACQATIPKLFGQPKDWIVKELFYSGPLANGCGFSRMVGSREEIYNYYQLQNRRSSTCSPGDYITPNGCTPEKPITQMNEQELLDKMAADSGWPSSAARAVQSAINKGIPVETDAPTVSGPSSVPGEKTVTRDSVNLNPGTNTEAAPGTPNTQPGTKTTTKTETKKAEYSGPNVTTSTTTNTVTNITNNVTNITTTVENKTEEKEDDEKQEDPPTDTPFKDIPELYKQKYPDGIGGVVNKKIDEIKATPLFSLPTMLAPSLPSSGSCPSWQLDLSLASWAGYGVQTIQAPCWVWDFGKVVIIISALLLARRLIFGG